MANRKKLTFYEAEFKTAKEKAHYARRTKLAE
jgi:hypothetical protein